MKSNLTAARIIKILESHKKEISTFGVTTIGLFGSFLKDKQGQKSDLDFVIELEEHTFDKYMDLKFFLEKVFGRKVDLVLKNNLKPALQYVEEEALYAQVA